MPYVQNSKKPIPGYRLARWHPGGKLWVSDLPFSGQVEATDYVDYRNAVLSDLDYGIQTPYFVWHADLTEADLEPYKAERSANKIK